MQEDGCGHFYKNSSKAGGVSVDQLQFTIYATVAVKTQAAMGCQQEYVCIKWGRERTGHKYCVVFLLHLVKSR
jgi:hypothetical protein